MNKTLIFNGSPRKNGDTSGLIDFFVKGLDGEHKMINTFSANIRSCCDCRFCKEHSYCKIDDGMMEIYSYIEQCDNILIASPLHFTELTGTLLNVLSRLQVYYCGRTFLKIEPVYKKKKGGILLVGGGNGDAGNAEKTARILLKQMSAVKIEPVIYCHDTDKRSALEDDDVLHKLTMLADSFNNTL